MSLLDEFQTGIEIATRPPAEIPIHFLMATSIFRILLCLVFFFSNAHTRAVDRRFVSPYNPTDKKVKFKPSVGTILEGIRVGALSFDYARWRWYQHKEPFLEIAYWIGPNVGIMPNSREEQNLRLDQYRGSNGGQSGMPDRWVVIHFHFDTSRRNVFFEDPRTKEVFIGTYAIRIFHGYSSSRAGRNLRVDGRESERNQRNARTALVPLPAGELWYLGYDAPANMQSDPRGRPQRIPSQFRTALQQFARSLWEQHIVDTRGLERIFEGQKTRKGQFDLQKSFPRLRGMMAEADPYQWSFTPDGRGGLSVQPNTMQLGQRIRTTSTATDMSIPISPWAMTEIRNNNN